LFVRNRSSLDKSGDSPELWGSFIFCEGWSRSSPDCDQATDSEIHNYAKTQIVGGGANSVEEWSKRSGRTYSPGAAEHQSRRFKEPRRGTGEGDFCTKVGWHNCTDRLWN